MTSYGQYTFPPITFDWNEIETWGRCQSVRLVKTHLLICNLTHLGRSVTLTLGDLRSNYQVTFPGHKVYESIRLDERKTMVAKSALYLK